MKPLHITTSFAVYEDMLSLPPEIQSLMDEAVLARKRAYAPYSKFNVGAAILLENGEVVTGNNQENASYPSGLCAERVAVYYAGARFPRVSIKAIAVTAASETYEVKNPAPPCGACRQSLLEYEVKQKADIPVYFMGAAGTVIYSASVRNLLPLSFDNSFL
ncbi:cytidine deaminase [Ascidiimonas aurantiaca]|uniref:cytidine deaminase n=1 Tax=Ascidiimonas aurantiaca TaxID=1685432 RepID=UPI0030EF340A